MLTNCLLVVKLLINLIDALGPEQLKHCPGVALIGKGPCLYRVIDIALDLRLDLLVRLRELVKTNGKILRCPTVPQRLFRQALSLYTWKPASIAGLKLYFPTIEFTIDN